MVVGSRDEGEECARRVSTPAPAVLALPLGAGPSSTPASYPRFQHTPQSFEDSFMTLRFYVSHLSPTTFMAKYPSPKHVSTRLALSALPPS